MGDAKDSCIFELLVDELLDCLFSHDVDIRSSFVKNHDLISAQNGPNYTNELPFSQAEIIALLLDLEIIQPTAFGFISFWGVFVIFIFPWDSL